MLLAGDDECPREHRPGDRREILRGQDMRERNVGPGVIGGEVGDLGAGRVLLVEGDQILPIVDGGEVPVHHGGRHVDIDGVDHAAGHDLTLPVGSAVPGDPSGCEALFGSQQGDQLITDEVLQLAAHQWHPDRDIGMESQARPGI